MATEPFYADDFVGGSYDYSAKGESAQRSVNLYTEQIEAQGGKTKFCLRSVKALRTWKAISGTCRGLYFDQSKGALWAVYGADVWRISSADALPVKVGSVAIDTARVAIAENGIEIVFADGQILYKADLLADDATVASTWSAVSVGTFDGNAIEPANVVQLGRLFFCDGAKRGTARSGTIFYSQINSTTFSDTDGVLNFFDASSVPDDMVALAAVGSRLYALRTRSFDVYALGDVEIVSRVESVASEIGCAARCSVASIGETLFWLGSAHAGHNSVWAVTGASAPIRISTNAIEEQLRGLDLSGAEGYCFGENGHRFYALTIRPGHTWVYDIATRQWHERAKRDWAMGVNYAWEPTLAVTAWDGVILFGCDGGIKELDGDADDDGLPVWRERTSPVYWKTMVPVVVRDFALDMEVATIKDLSARPVVMLSVSTDGGRTFFDLGWRSIGQTGRFRTEIEWQNLGEGRTFVARTTFTEPCDVAIFGARLELETGSFR